MHPNYLLTCSFSSTAALVGTRGARSCAPDPDMSRLPRCSYGPNQGSGRLTSLVTGAATSFLLFANQGKLRGASICGPPD